jgi:hypothetical protein
MIEFIGTSVTVSLLSRINKALWLIYKGKVIPIQAMEALRVAGG